MRNLVYIVLLTALSTWAQQTPAPAQQGEITIKSGTAHLGNGKVVENAVISIKDGKIMGVESATGAAASGTVIDATGKHIYPGFLALDTTLGLVEVSAVRASNDDDEIGEFNPNIEAIVAYNAESKAVESLRPNGVLLAQTVPRGGTISGTSSIVQLDAWNWEDAVIKRSDGIHLNWPNSYKRGRWWLDEEPGYSENEDYKKEVAAIVDFLAQAQAYAVGNGQNRNLVFEATRPALEGKANLYIHVDGEKEILDVLRFKKEMNLDKIVLVGAYRAYQVAKEIAAANLPVILARTHSLPGNEDDDYDISYKMAKTLTDAGVLVALGNSGEYWQSRNLPFYAGQVTAHGMGFEDALMLITANAAKIVGLDDQMGTLEVGKDATLFISEGNALEMMGNTIDQAMIQGRDISLESHQTELWHRYMEKYGREQE